MLTGASSTDRQAEETPPGFISTCISPKEGKEIAMNSILLIVWAVLIVLFLALLVYRGQLSRYEDEQLFLNSDDVTPEEESHQILVRRLQKIDPIVKLVGGAAGLATAFAVGLYVWDAWQKLQS
jgi:hypothetical protein